MGQVAALKYDGAADIRVWPKSDHLAARYGHCGIRNTNGKAPPEKIVDDLTKIIGIGKVFQHTLNQLGIYSFQQLASFRLADIARVNMALKENKGRIEQDDWIGQAKELYFTKYSETVNDQ